MGIYNKIPRIPIPACLPMRYLISIECFFGLTISYVIRFCLSLAMIKMASHHKSAQADTESCPYNASEQHANASKGDFEWTEIEQGRVLASMFVGYLVAMIPSGMLGDMLGAGPMLTMGVLLSSVASVLTPLAAYHSSITLCVLRAFLGVFEAMVYAPLHCIVAAWIPPQERGTWSSVVFSGSHAGSFLNGVLTGTFLGPMSLHWSTVFYIYGIAGFVWTFIFLFTTYSRPSDCPHLSEKEKKFLEEADLMKPLHKEKPSWSKVLTNLPVWAVIVGMAGHDWGIFILVSDLPKFMYAILHFNIGSNGYLYASVFFSIWAVGNITGVLTDFVDKRKIIGRTLNRKIGTTIASVGPSLGLVLSVYTNCSVELALVALFIGSALMGFFYSSLKVSPIDIAPRFSGFVGAVAQTAGAASGFAVPYVVGALTPNSSLSEWRIVMWVSFIFMSVTNVFYVVFATADIQAFNSPEDAERIKQEKEAKKAEKEAKKAGKKGKPETMSGGERRASKKESMEGGKKEGGEANKSTTEGA
uniref:Putative inorganic phosphate cotransporter n=1 Tax=Lygus hesperus TaxID=30085 RepID=A0A0A9YYR3_LYGHE